MYPHYTQMNLNQSAPIPHLSFNSSDELTELYQAVEYIPEDLEAEMEQYGAMTDEQKALIDIIHRLKTIHDNYINQLLHLQ